MKTCNLDIGDIDIMQRGWVVKCSFYIIVTRHLAAILMSILVFPECIGITAPNPSGGGEVNAQFGEPSGDGTYEAFLLHDGSILN